MARERKTTPAAAPVEEPKNTRSKKTSAAQAPETTKKDSGRAVASDNAERLEYILKRTKEEPGVTSPTLAKELDITTLACSQLTDRLVKKGELSIFKLASGVRTNYMPKDLAKVEAKLIKARDLELAEREANRAQKSKEALEALKASKKTTKTPAPVEAAEPTRNRRKARAA